jgi:hypothetical protein
LTWKPTDGADVRKLVTISSAAAAAVAATVVAAYAAGGDEPAGAGATAKSPTGPIVLKHTDSVAPRKGSDYRLLVKLRHRNARNAEGVTTSSEVVIGRRSGDLLLDPVSRQRTHLRDAGDVLDATDETVTFLRSKPGDRSRCGPAAPTFTATPPACSSSGSPDHRVGA